MPETHIECRELVKSFEGVRAVNSISLRFEAGRVNALIGPNGAGKTTIFHLIAGALRPDAGEIRLAGRRIDRESTWKIARRGVGRLFQDVRIFGGLSVLENVLVSFPGQRGERPLNALARPWLIRRQEAELARRAVEALDRVGLAALTNRKAENLSYGQQKLLALARLSAAGSRILLLDEPAAGIDPEMLKRVLTQIRNWADEGCTVVLIEHNMGVVAKIADWVYFLDAGRLISSGPTNTVLAQRSVMASYLGVETSRSHP